MQKNKIVEKKIVGKKFVGKTIRKVHQKYRRKHKVGNRKKQKHMKRTKKIN